jgi:hypothetical protein
MLTEETYRNLVAAHAGQDVVDEIPEHLVPLWCNDYYFSNPKAELLLVDLKDSGTEFNYLFDIGLGRVVVAFGVPIFATHKRDAGRMAGHPLSAGGEFHRGHLMAHSIGGGTDINLVPQLGKLNIGEFRRLERLVRDRARDNLKCLYFVRCIYLTGSQTPSLFEQCVISPSRVVNYARHRNL